LVPLHLAVGAQVLDPPPERSLSFLPADAPGRVDASSHVKTLLAVRCLLLASLALSIAACRSPAGPVPPPQPTPLALQCPANVLAEIVSGTSATVTFPDPIASGGTAPVSISCATPSGSRFQTGLSNVSCTATDARAQQASCSFAVQVALIPQLRGTKVVAFGDSITFGEVQAPAQPGVLVYDPLNAYPTLLGGLLTGRYKAQSITVINEGEGGERLLVTGEDRMEDVVERHRPDVLIVFEGVNDLNSGAAPVAASEALRRGVRRAVRAGVPLVMVSTILPGVPGRTKPPDPLKVDAMNAEIRAWVGTERAVLVDNFATFFPRRDTLIGVDGLHPTVEGMRVLAENFFGVIRDRFEASPGQASARGLWPWR
jgi:lysophospholipase L1-like esterase